MWWVCGKQWFFVGWDPIFIRVKNPSIEFLELYAVTAGVMLWINQFANSRICLFCDNKSVVYMINSSTSSCKNCMILIRILTLQGPLHNVVIKAQHVRSTANSRADAISRRKFKLFHRLANYQAEDEPLCVPEALWPMTKVWFD